MVDFERIISKECLAVFLLAQCFCILPISKQTAVSGLKKLRYGTLYKTSATLATTCLLIDYIVHFSSRKDYLIFYETKYQTENIHQQVEITFSILTFTFMFYVCLFQDSKQFDLIKDFFEIENDLDTLNPVNSHSNRNSYITFTRIYLILFLLYITISLTSFFLKIFSGISAIPLYSWLVIMINTVQVIMVINLLKLIKGYLAFLNVRILQNSLNLGELNFFFFLRLHDKTLDLIRKMNSVCGFKMVLCIAYIFFTITNETLLFSDILLCEFQAPLPFAMLSIFWVLCNFSLILGLCFKGTEVNDEVSFRKKTLYKYDVIFA